MHGKYRISPLQGLLESMYGKTFTLQLRRPLCPFLNGIVFLLLSIRITKYRSACNNKRHPEEIRLDKPKPVLCTTL